MSVVSILIESAALYSIWALVFLIAYARGSGVQDILFPPLGQVQGIAPLLIIARVIRAPYSEFTTNPYFSSIYRTGVMRSQLETFDAASSNTQINHYDHAIPLEPLPNHREAYSESGVRNATSGKAREGNVHE
ncbi:hypothetical protein VKT23_018434 [Stygiomarasmius scandens]|uniref:Uncharacterized protein n=1 Tax=Marasmiellus scandens TaxID=2682957 RepID=A0ABR1IS68_9AGAR